MIFVDTSDPDVPYTWAPRLAEPLTFESCGVKLNGTDLALYLNAPPAQPLAIVTALNSPLPRTTDAGHGCWVEFPLGSDTWYHSFCVGAVADQTWTITAIPAIPHAASVAIKIVKYWTD